ncbi:hypothetical protein GCM10010492_58740 [Saccharothrix mutabilis subsp. mutabilis]|uniref:DUF5655 domain-containing protein n=1 Tax=Saccharothrix mutabilis subsp. mutabilis TaxID=66855 RepID=A0ABP3E2P6_9PSEU
MGTTDEYFAGHPFAADVFERVRRVVAGFGEAEVRVSRSQVALRRRRGFAYVWLPGKYLAKPAAEVVVSFALGRRDPSPRFKEVVQPAAGQWMHHLEVRDPAEVDDEVRRWLREAYDRAG